MQCVPLMNDDETGLPRWPQGSTGSKGWGTVKADKHTPFDPSPVRGQEGWTFTHCCLSHVEQRAEFYGVHKATLISLAFSTGFRLCVTSQT